MTSATLGSETRLTEEQYFALPPTSERVELFDGKRVVTPAPNNTHQYIATKLTTAFDLAAEPRGLIVMATINLRLWQDTVPIPDLVIVTHAPSDETSDADAAVLVCEIVSPSKPSRDKVKKMRAYARARIPWYLVAEQTGDLHLYRLEGKHYVQHSVALQGETLHLTEPVEVSIDTTKLRLPK
ncbi:Uma2 family endonuclease [Actinoplanes sp. RD1]|uniref:Uma2 family endonuclease n=1 Tax=Actinoplanes sp. RD1 TaxID=3064538 RepID=UPI0027417C46|nr:Uma2 family endonuclease [Actinoplanes sp. RD1]